jgi:type I restriction enzyme S subunit
MGKYQAYPEYKNSGVEWLEDLPVHWEVKRTKAMFRLARQLVGRNSKDYQLLSLTLKGVIPRDISDGGGKIPAEFDTYQVVRPKNLIFCLFDIDETPRTIGISSHDGMITGAYNVYSSLEPCVPEYAYYYFMHIDSFKGLKPFYTGLRKVVRAETFSNIKMPVPSKEEQEKIANFLDHETAKIDTLIEKQQQLIKLVKEKRQAVISHAVTKGLNPDAPMRDSGVEWLGEVPEHWEVTKLGQLAFMQEGPGLRTWQFKDQGTRVICVTNITEQGINFSKLEKFISDEEYLQSYQHFTVNPGDILLSSSGNSWGKVAKYEGEEKVILNTSTIRLNELRHKPLALDYIKNFLHSEACREQLGVAMTGSCQPNFGPTHLKEIRTPIPPEREQYEISEYIAQQLFKFDQPLLACEQAIQLMQERRTALISAAVTGKIDVRNWVAPESSITIKKDVAA